MTAFALGSSVTWTSQAKGVWKTKRGTVAEIVAAGARPDRARFPELYRHSGVGFSRAYTSYVVVVGRNNKPFWPWPNRLRLEGAPEPPTPPKEPKHVKNA